jgi:ATP-binding cassette subfamily F protein uup
MDYKGTVLLVSHDREFVNNVVTSTLVFEEGGQVNEYVGGYDDWLKYSAEVAKKNVKSSRAGSKSSVQIKDSNAQQKKAKKLSYNDQRELDSLPSQIENFEKEVDALQQSMASDDFYKQDEVLIKEMQQQLVVMQEKLSHCYTRWEELE